MNSDRPHSNHEPAQIALECCPDPMPQEGQPVGECICPRRSYPGIVPDDPPGLGDIYCIRMGCPVHWQPMIYHTESVPTSTGES